MDDVNGVDFPPRLQGVMHFLLMEDFYSKLQRGNLAL